MTLCFLLLTMSAGSAQAAELIGICKGENLCAATEQGKLKQLTTDGSTERPYFSPSASLDGSVVNFILDGAPFSGGRLGQNAEQLLDTRDGTRMRVTPDGETLAFSQFGVIFSGGGFELESALFVAGELGSARYGSTRQVLDGNFLDNDTLLLGTNFNEDVNDEICTVPLVPSSEPPPCGTLVATEPGRSLEIPTASPDGKLLAVESVVRDPDTAARLSSRIALYDPSNGQLIRELTSGTDDRRPEFSPDGKRVAFTRGDDTFVVPVAGGQAEVLARGLTDADWYGPTGSPKLAGSKLKLKGRRLTATAVCGEATGCEAATLTLRRKGVRQAFAKLRIPELLEAGRKRVRTKVSAASARLVVKAGKRGLRLEVSGGKPRSVTVVG